MYLFGAICPQTGQGVGYLMPTVDPFCMNLHLAEIQRAVPPRVHVALILDGAGWHGSKDLKVSDNITLIPQPPYSPELNSMEMVWLFSKRHHLSNRTDTDREALEEAEAQDKLAFYAG